jgi:hypothetical protein
MDSTCLLRSKSYSSPDDGQYVSSQVKIIELPRWWTVRVFSGQNHIAPQMMDSTCLLRSNSYSSPDDGQYVPSQVWPEKARTVHHLGSSMILIWEHTYCPSSEELYDFDLRRQVLSIICGALSFWPEKACTLHHLESSMILSWEDTYCPSFGGLCDFDVMSKSYSSPDDGQYVSSHVKIIELPRWWTVRVFSCQNHRAPQMMDSTCLLRSKSYSSPDDGQ